MPPEQPGEVLPDVCFCRDSKEISKKAMIKEEGKGKWASPAPEFTTTHSEVVNSRHKGVLCVCPTVSY